MIHFPGLLYNNYFCNELPFAQPTLKSEIKMGKIV